MSSPDTPAPPRERQTLNGAILASGVGQAIQFVLPLFAGAVLGLPPGQTIVPFPTQNGGDSPITAPAVLVHRTRS